MSVVLVAVVAAIALVVQPPAPPGIAAFAPQASKPITKAPPGQSSVNGNGNGSCAAGQVCTKPTPTTSSAPRASLRPVGPSAQALVGVPSALQCYAWPDGSVTQTFDPQSPPCIATWPGQAKGNGGATAQGVSATEIRVAYPQNTKHTQLADMRKIVDFFNSRYQLYGRKIVLAPFRSQQAEYSYAVAPTPVPELQRADALSAAAQKVFAAVDFVDGTPNPPLILPEYVDTLASKHVISSTGGLTTGLSGSKHLSAHAPYEWSYYPQMDELMTNAATAICRQLVGKPATRSPDFPQTTRKFAVLLPDRAATGVALAGVDLLTGHLKACGAEPTATIYYAPYDDTGGQGFQASMINLKQKGVTTLVFFPWNGVASSGGPQQLAGRVGYHPEFFTLGWQQAAAGQLGYEATPQERAALFGIGAWNKLRPSPDQPWGQAYATSGESISGKSLQGGAAFYQEMLLLAAGFQMAGPHLTPASFAGALHSTTFPNPGAGTAPFFQARVGFSGQQGMVKDFNAWWIDPTTSASTVPSDAVTYNPYRNFCYVGLGRRWSGEGWPTQDRYFSGGCR